MLPLGILQTLLCLRSQYLTCRRRGIKVSISRIWAASSIKMLSYWEKEKRESFSKTVWKPNNYCHNHNHHAKTDRQKSSPGWCGSVDWELACKPKGCQFHSQSGHMPGFRARSPVGGVQVAGVENSHLLLKYHWSKLHFQNLPLESIHFSPFPPPLSLQFKQLLWLLQATFLPVPLLPVSHHLNHWCSSHLITSPPWCQTVTGFQLF